MLVVLSLTYYNSHGYPLLRLEEQDFIPTFHWKKHKMSIHLRRERFLYS